MEKEGGPVLAPGILPTQHSPKRVCGREKKRHTRSRANWFLPSQKKAPPSPVYPGPPLERNSHNRGPLCARLYFVVELGLLNSFTHSHTTEKKNIHFFLRRQRTFLLVFFQFPFSLR